MNAHDGGTGGKQQTVIRAIRFSLFVFGDKFLIFQSEYILTGPVY